MIFVTLGTQDKSFIRLMEEVQKMIDNNVIEEEVIAQIGCTKFCSEDIQVFDYMDMETFNTYIDDCDILITHGGVGSILTGLNADKKVIAIARREKYKEHDNDHQVEIVEKFTSKQYILGSDDVNDLTNCLQQLKTFKSEKYESNNASFCTHLKQLIDR